MTTFLQIGGYLALFVLLTLGGNFVCKWVLRASHINAPPETGEKMSSLASILWAVVITVGFAAYDHMLGFGILPLFLRLLPE
jgi:hypothetical protein